jgi:hypothetical protein
MGIRLATFQQHQLTAQDYALLCAKSVSSGIFYGCNVTIKDESTLHVTSGVGIANGRTFDVTDDDYPVELTGGGSMVGRIYVHVDLADVDTPAQILVVKGATLPALVQDSDMNESTGVWDLELATFDVDASEISNLVYTASGVSGGGGGAMLAPYYDASEAWLKDQIFQKDGALYKCLTDIAVGTPLVVDTNVKVTNFAEETEALNQNLTIRNTRWNPTTDRFEVLKNGSWVQSIRAFVNSIAVFVAGVFGIEIENGVYTSISGYSGYPFNITSSDINTGNLASGQGCTLVSAASINFSNYSKIKAIVDGSEKELNISGVSGVGYLGIGVTDSMGTNYLTISAIRSKQNNFTASANVYETQSYTLSGSNTHITEITIE